MTYTAKLPLRSSQSTLKGVARVPGDKSLSHRALILASQKPGLTHIHDLLEGEDVHNTATALQQLGVKLQRTAPGEWHVKGSLPGNLQESPGVLEMGNSGTSTRLLMGLVTPYPFSTFFAGDTSLSKRPMKRVITPLSQMGAQFTAHSGDRLPLTLTGTANPQPLTYTLPVASAQVKSAILLAALNTPGTTIVTEPHATRDHTENMLRFLGYELHTESSGAGITIRLKGKQQPSENTHDITIPADPSSAAFPMVGALISPGSEITIPNICINPLRTGLIETLREMGAMIEYANTREMVGEPVADVRVCHCSLKAITVPAERAPSMIDEYPILAVAAAFATGESIMHGLSELRVKESDRLAAIIDGLTACGVEAWADGDSLHVRGTAKPKGGAMVTTHYDHRIAMSFLVLGMASSEPVDVDDATAINTSFPHFALTMNRLGACITPADSMPAPHRPLVIAVDGPAASGKGTLARRLAEHYGLDYLDTGGLYRAVGMKLVYSGKDPKDKAAAIEAARSIDTDDLANPRLRQERIGQAASIVSAYPEVRTALLDFQRDFAKRRKGVVLDGRDIGTVVCPDADFKFFITATLYARAKRRHKELTGEGIEVVFESVLDDLRERDERDEKRAVAPMVPAEDAVLMDTSTLDASEVFAQACDIIGKRADKLE